MNDKITALVLLCGSLLFTACQTAPPVGYADTPHIVEKRTELCNALIQLLPEAQRSMPEAQAEARWLADTAYKGAESIGRINKPERWPAWRNNVLVNTPGRLERGLCWHYQHDMFRELRRRPLQFFKVGCCVRDQKTGSEHNCVYLCAKDAEWPNVWVLDAWKNAGRLVVMSGTSLDLDDWLDRPDSTEWLEKVYPEGHRYPIEHWATVRLDSHWNEHKPSFTAEGYNASQAVRMRENMKKGLEARKGNPTDYSVD